MHDCACQVPCATAAHACCTCTKHSVVCLHFVVCSMLVAEPSNPQLDQLLQKHPVISNWMQRVRNAVGHAVYDDAHSKLRAAVHRLGAAAKQAGGGGASKL